jgi:8-oxo-dGTP diphosphatase
LTDDRAPRPTVGVQAIVAHPKRHRSILLGKRRGGFGDGQWGLPGGHLEFGESFEQATARELTEETGLSADQLYVWKAINTPYVTTHYVQIGVQVAKFHGDMRNLEPDKCADLRWCSLDALPQPLFTPSVPFLDLLRQRDAMPSTADTEPHLSVFLNCIEPDRHEDKYVVYQLLGAPAALYVRSGRRHEKVDRLVRRYLGETVDDLLRLLRGELRHRLGSGYLLYDAHGTYDLETVRQLFPEGTVAFRSISSKDGARDFAFQVHTELMYARAQLTLFDTVTQDGRGDGKA